MPCEISFTRPVGIRDRAQYINECCVGGDAVVDALLPAVRALEELGGLVEAELRRWGASGITVVRD